MIFSNHDRNIRIISGIILASTVLGLYLWTMPPTLTLGWQGKGADGGELLTAAYTLGIPHPPGYPTYMLLLKGFGTIVPIGDFAFRGNLFSALMATLSVVSIYWVVVRICRRIVPDAPEWFCVVSGLLSGTIFGSSPLLWSQAIITEVYSLNAAFAGFLLLIVSDMLLPTRSVRPRNKWTDRIFISLFGFLLGLGLGNHFTLLAVALPLSVWIAKSKGWKELIAPWSLISLLLGVSIYAYLPLRADQGSPVNWGEADTIDGMLWMLMARPYQEYVFGIPTSSIPDKVLEWIAMVFDQFNPLGLFLGIVGAVPLLKLTKSLFLSTLTAMLIVTVYATMYHSVDSEVLMIPALLLFAVWVGVGLFWVMTGWLRDFESHWDMSSKWQIQIKVAHQAVFLTVLAFLLLPILAVVLNYDTQNLRSDRSTLERATTLLDATPDGAILFSTTEREVFPLLYARFVAKPERDVALVVVPLLQFEWYVDDLNEMFPRRIPEIRTTDIREAMKIIVKHNQGRSKVYSTYRGRNLSEDFELQFDGMLYEAKLRKSS